MISVKLDGRLGNQLFQYAFIYSASKKLKTNFYLDKTLTIFLLPKYFLLPKDFIYPLDNTIFSISGFKHLFCIHLKKKIYKYVQTILKLRPLHFDSDTNPYENLNKLENKKLYIGYFQSEEYFKSYRKEIRSLFKLKSRYILEFSELLKIAEIPSNFTVIHIRKGDYVSLGWNLPMSYYHKSIKHLDSIDDFCVFISDEPDFIDSEFSYIKNKYVSKNQEIIDFQFLINANKLILSSSSFSWWGAYLNSVSDTCICIPKYYVGWKNEIEFPVQIIPENWTQIDVKSDLEFFL